MLKDMDFHDLQKNIKKHWLNASKKFVYKAGEFLGNKILDAITKSNDDNIEKQEPVQEIIIPLGKREEI